MNEATDSLTPERLRAVVDYDRETGQFTWMERTSIRIVVGKIAGTLRPNGYVMVGIDGTQYRAHRLAWFYVHGEWPAGDIDHMNGSRADNRLANLRIVTNAVNGQNRQTAQRDNKLGFLGVFKCKKRYQAQVKLNGKITHVGTFDTPEQAHAAYLVAKRKLHEGCTI